MIRVVLCSALSTVVSAAAFLQIGACVLTSDESTSATLNSSCVTNHEVALRSRVAALESENADLRARLQVVESLVLPSPSSPQEPPLPPRWPPSLPPSLSPSLPPPPPPFQPFAMPSISGACSASDGGNCEGPAKPGWTQCAGSANRNLVPRDFISPCNQYPTFSYVMFRCSADGVSADSPALGLGGKNLLTTACHTWDTTPATAMKTTDAGVYKYLLSWGPEISHVTGTQPVPASSCNAFSGSNQNYFEFGMSNAQWNCNGVSSNVRIWMYVRAWNTYLP